MVVTTPYLPVRLAKAFVAIALQFNFYLCPILFSSYLTDIDPKSIPKKLTTSKSPSQSFFKGIQPKSIGSRCGLKKLPNEILELDCSHLTGNEDPITEGRRNINIPWMPIGAV